MLRAAGHTSDLFALTIDDGLRGDVRPFGDPAARQGDATIFHFALPSPMTSAFGSLAGRRIVQYHNITPASFFAPYDTGLFRLAALGRQELKTLAGRVDLALGDSEFNRQELEALGFAPTGVMPIAVNTERITNAPRRPALEKILADGLINILFVGRIVPNKRIDDHIRLAELYKRNIDSYYRFIFVGRYDGVPSYYAQIRALIAEFQMLPDRFWFTGPVPGPGSGGVLSLGRRLCFAERARRVLRPAGRGHGGRRTGPRLRCRRRARDAWWRRRVVRPERSRTRVGNAGHARIRSTSSRSGDRGTETQARGFCTGSHRSSGSLKSCRACRSNADC